MIGGNVLKLYDPDDIMTCYFVVLDDGKNRQIRGWTDSKSLAEAYMEFHSCKGMTLKSSTKKVRDMVDLLNENVHDEIQIFNITIRDPEKKKKHQDNTKRISIPATEVEMQLIRDEGANFMYSAVGYSYINSAFPYLKNKYQKALSQIFLTDVMNKVLHNQTSPLIQAIQVDQLAILIRSFPEQFG